MDVWDIEWIDADGTPLKQSDGTPLKHQDGLDREAAEQQARHWAQDKPGSRVYLYRRRGNTSVLIKVWNAG
jgi:hypothetical protein